MAARRVRVSAAAAAVQRATAARHDALVSDAPALSVTQRRMSGVDGRVQVGRAEEREAALARQPAARTAVWHACDDERRLCEDRLTLVDIAAGEEAAAAAGKVPNGDSRRRGRRRRSIHHARGRHARGRQPAAGAAAVDAAHAWRARCAGDAPRISTHGICITNKYISAHLARKAHLGAGGTSRSPRPAVSQGRV